MCMINLQKRTGLFFLFVLYDLSNACFFEVSLQYMIKAAAHPTVEISFSVKQLLFLSCKCICSPNDFASRSCKLKKLLVNDHCTHDDDYVLTVIAVPDNTIIRNLFRHFKLHKDFEVNFGLPKNTLNTQWSLICIGTSNSEARTYMISQAPVNY